MRKIFAANLAMVALLRHTVIYSQLHILRMQDRNPELAGKQSAEIKKICEAESWSLKELAGMAGVSSSTLYSVNSGQSTSERTMQSIRNAVKAERYKRLGVSPPDRLGEDFVPRQAGDPVLQIEQHVNRLLTAWKGNETKLHWFLQELRERYAVPDKGDSSHKGLESYGSGKAS